MLGGGGGSSDEPERGYGPSCLSSAASVTYTRTHTLPLEALYRIDSSSPQA